MTLLPQEADATGFNPLHCGAVVASPWLLAAVVVGAIWFQSPSLRGSGRFDPFAFQPRPAAGSQSPSLRGSGRFGPAMTGQRCARTRLNPLHCGAVVASRRGAGHRPGASQSPSLRGSGRFALRRALPTLDPEVSIPFIAGQWSLRIVGVPTQLRREQVSIPFIAGQWSLRTGSGRADQR